MQTDEPNWNIQETIPKEAPKKMEDPIGRCPFHPNVKLDIAKVSYHFLYRCKEANKLISDGKWYKFCNCGNVFVDHNKYNKHLLECEYSSLKATKEQMPPTDKSTEGEWWGAPEENKEEKKLQMMNAPPEAQVEIIPGKITSSLSHSKPYLNEMAVRKHAEKKTRYFDEPY
jgi:hypothetical protein